MKLQEFFSVSERTVRRWEAAGADLTSAPRLLAFLRNLARPSARVERLLEDLDCERRLVSLLNTDEPEDSHENKLKALAGDPDFEPFFTLPDADEGDDDGGSGAFEARLMADLRQALTGFGILVRMLGMETGRTRITWIRRSRETPAWCWLMEGRGSRTVTWLPW